MTPLEALDTFEIDPRVAWLAGLVEAKGCFSTARNAETVRFEIEMDYDAVQSVAILLEELVPADLTRQERLCWPVRGRSRWRVTVTGRRAMLIAKKLRPYLHTNRKARINELLATEDLR